MLALVVLGALGPCADVSACMVQVRAADDLLPHASAALESLKLRLSEPRVGPLKIDAKVLKGDVWFRLELEWADDKVLVRALSLHRPPSVFGRAVETVQPLPKPEQKKRALGLAVRVGIERAMEDLTAQLEEAAGRGRRTIRLTIKVNGLDGTTRRQVVDAFVPCLKGQFDALGAVTEPHEVAGYLEDVIEYVPAKDEPRDSVQWQAERLKRLTLGLKAICPSPARKLTRFSADTVNRGVLIELE